MKTSTSNCDAGVHRGPGGSCSAVLLLAVLALSHAGLAQEPGAPLVAALTDEDLHVDGVLDEPAWLAAPRSRPWAENQDGSPAKLTTTAQVLYDHTAVYIGVRCEEPDVANPVLHSSDPHSLDIWRDDSIEVFLDPGQTRSRYYQIIVNAVGRAVAGHNGLYEPMSPVSAAVHQAAHAWSAEIRVPFAQLGVRPRAGEQWGGNFYRTRCARRDGDGTQRSAWNPTHGGFREPHRFGSLLLGGREAVSAVPSPEQQARTRQRVLEEAGRSLAGTGRWTPADLNPEAGAERAARLTSLVPRLCRLDEPVLTAGGSAITDDPILPWTVPAAESLDPVVEVAACREEFEPATFTVFATRDLKDITLEVDALAGPEGRRLEPSAVDVRQVLCWYQAGWAHISRSTRTLVPELLVKDGSLVEVDPAARENRLSFHGLPTDSQTLRPFDLPAFETRQIWLTFRPPAEALAGRYVGRVCVRQGGATIAAVPLRLTVQPFTLAPPVLSYSLYYRLRPSNADDPAGTMRRMAAELRNQVEHGINMPSTYIGAEALRPEGPPMEALEELTRIYRDLGLRDHPLILVTTAVGRQSSPQQLEGIKAMVGRFVAWARPRGYRDVYFHAIDEGGPEVLRAERAAFQAVHEAGGKVFVACGADYLDAVGDLLDMPVVGGPLRPDVAAKAKALGHRVFSYANPQAGVELPATYRRNYGLKLWAAGYAGGFDYEYQAHGIEQAYNDFHEPHYRNHTMAYPTTGAPIDTRQWEGWREGVDDVRYLSTLLKMLEDAEKTGRDPDLSHRARRWLATITGGEDLDSIRRQIADYIIALTP